MSARSKKISLGLSVGVLSLIAIVGIIVAGVIALRGAGMLPDHTTAPGTDAGTGQSLPVVEGCIGVTAVMEGTVDAAPVTDWGYLGRVAVPTSETAGPARTADDGFPSCFARTPEGALFAAANTVLVSSTPELAKAHAETMYAEDPRKAATVKQIQEATTGATQALSLAGFRVLSYDGEEATVDTAWRVGPTLVASVVVQLRWERGDWLVVPPAEDAPSIVQLPNLGGYIPWSAP